MKTIAAGKFKAQCLALLDDVHDHGHEVVITKRGKAMARLVPMAKKEPASVIGALEGKLRVAGDIVSPIVQPWEWDEDVFPPGTPEREEFERSKHEARRKRAAR